MAYVTSFFPVEINITQAVFFFQSIINDIRIRRNQGDQQITYKGNSHVTLYEVICWSNSNRTRG